VQPEQRELNQGFATTLNKGFEFAVMMAVFGGLGYLIDRALGTAPVFLALLMVFALVGQSARLWYAYVAAMKRYEAGLPSNARGEDR
jgi:F0F1-type ATP synthase assembly protein I